MINRWPRLWIKKSGMPRPSDSATIDWLDYLLILGNQQKHGKQTNVCGPPLTVFKEDVSGVYDQIIQYRNNVSVAANQGFNPPWIKFRLGLVTTVFLLLLLGLFAALKFLPSTTWVGTEDRIRLVIQFAVFAAYIIAGGIVLAHFVSLKNMFKDFTGQMVGLLDNASKGETALFSRLDSYSITSIRYIASRVEQSTAQIGQLRSLAFRHQS